MQKRRLRPLSNLFKTNSGRIKLRGQGVSPGIAIGHVRLFQMSSLDVGESNVIEQNVEQEVNRFQEAIENTRQQIYELGQRIEQRGEDKALNEVLNMHLLLLEDKMIVDEVIKQIRQHGYGAEYALSLTYREVEKRYSDLPDLFRERLKDVEGICRRIMDNLRGAQAYSLEDLTEECIVVARDLSPSDTASMRSETVLGFVTEVGGKTSHTAILARALEIPAIVGVHPISRFVQDDDMIIIDGNAGQVIVNPTEEDLYDSRARQNQYQVRQSRLISMRQLPSVTLDGHRIELAANIEFATEIETANKYGAEGVGLYRTEYLFLNRLTIPTEHEQYEHYNQVAETLSQQSVVIRTLDIGGDKFSHAFENYHELNPYLGCRAIRFSLENRELFKTQLRAILRASQHRNIRLMYPLISGVAELQTANEILDQLKADLQTEGVDIDHEIPVGAMIEVPSAVMIAADLAEHLSFLSIGTNDLIQYALAVDRGNEKIAHLYQPLHPAVLRMISMVVQVGEKKGIPVSVCGEMASDPVCVLVLLSLGIERLSMAPSAIPLVKDVVRNVQLARMRDFGARLLQCSQVGDVKQLLQDELTKLLPESSQLFQGINASTLFANPS